MLLGTYKPNAIGNNRFALPINLRREIFSEKLIFSIGFEKCIMVFEEKKWEEVTLADLSRPLSDTVGRNLRRKLCMNAQTISLDSQGRFVVPEAMVEHCQLKENIIIIGAGDHFEIWDLSIWENYQKKENL